MSSAKVQLYSAWFCPFAQRPWIALLHKNVDFEYIEQDPYNKSPEWLAINPRGLVPAIVHHGTSVVESTICDEYIDEAFPHAPRLLPADPLGRAHVRQWVDFIGKKVVPNFYRILVKESTEERQEAAEAFSTGLATVTAAKKAGGPFFMGADFGIVDIALVPYFLRIPILKHYRNYDLPAGPAFTEFQKWMQAVSMLESVKKTVPDPAKLLAYYKRYADGSAKTEVADAVRKGTALP